MSRQHTENTNLQDLLETRIRENREKSVGRKPEFRRLTKTEALEKVRLEEIQEKTRKAGMSHIPVIGKKVKRSKYGNKKTVVDNIRFDSKREANRWLELKAMQERGEISHLKRQEVIELVVNGVHVCKYIADFHYAGAEKWIYEDVKGMKTAIYRLKKKLVFACKGIEIFET